MYTFKIRKYERERRKHIQQISLTYGVGFCKKEAKETMRLFREEFAKLDLKELSLDELLNCRFGKWTEQSLLCPLYAQPILKPGEDNDVRFGCIASGWEIKDGAVVWANDKGIMDDE